MSKAKALVDSIMAERADESGIFDNLISAKIMDALEVKRVELASGLVPCCDDCAEDSAVNESRKLVGTYNHENGQTTKVYKLTGSDFEGDDYHVKLFSNAGKHYEPADYFTNDAEDAHSTAKDMVRRALKESEQIDELKQSTYDSVLGTIMDRMKKGQIPMDQARKHRKAMMMAATLKAVNKPKDGTVQEALSPEINTAHGEYELLRQKNDRKPVSKGALQRMQHRERMAMYKDNNICPSCGGEGAHGYEEESGLPYTCYACAGTGKWDYSGKAGKKQAVSEKIDMTDTQKVISDFVKSDDPKFKGKSKKERIRMALGASYAAKREKGMNEATTPVTAKEKSLAKKYGDPKKITHGDVVTARIQSGKKVNEVAPAVAAILSRAAIAGGGRLAGGAAARAGGSRATQMIAKDLGRSAVKDALSAAERTLQDRNNKQNEPA